MGTVATILGALLGLGGIAAGIVYWMKRSAAVAVNLDQSNAELAVERQRVDSMEAAAASERAAQTRLFDENARAVVSASDAAELLATQFPGVPGP